MSILSEQNDKLSSGFVSKQLFRTLLIIGLAALSFSVVINTTIVDAPAMVIINAMLIVCYGLLLILINKITLRTNMRLGMIATTFGMITIMLFDLRGMMWVVLIPLVAFALFGKKEGEPWVVAGLCLVCFELVFDVISSSPIYTLEQQVNIVLAYIVISLIAWFYVRHIEASHQIILNQKTEKERLEVAHQLAGGIAHLINNEMQGILGTVSLLKMQGQDKEDSKKLESIVELSTRASSHANQLLSYAHGGKYCVQAIDMQSIMVDLSEMWKKHLPKPISFKLHMASSLPSCDGDPKQIRQMLIGLFENAKEACCEKGGEIEFSIASDDLRNDCPTGNLKTGHYLKLFIKDTGCGVEQEALTKIFEPFFSTKFIGRGLGLAAIHGIVNNHGGHIMVESELGIGSQFTVWLPTSKTSTPNYS